MIDPAVFPNWKPFHSLGNVISWRWGMRGLPSPVPPKEELERDFPVLTPDAEALNSPPADRVQVTWLGHASVLVQWEGWSVLADPIFSERCAPVQWAGPKRVRPAPLQVDALPPVDAVVISHNHYDHLDEATVKALAKQQPGAIFFVPLGMKAWFASCGLSQVVEMDWTESVTLDGHQAQPPSTAADPAVPAVPARLPLTISCVPCQHWCKRTPSDLNKCLWCSWICKTPSMSYYFGGDTGYCGEVFRAVRQEFGVTDLAAIPIGAYGTPEERWFHQPNHMNPEEAVNCHQDLGARQSVAVHWGTFALTGEPLGEPPRLLAASAAKHGLREDEFACFKQGEIRKFDLLRAAGHTAVPGDQEPPADSDAE